MNYILFDDSTRMDMLPLTFMRPVADIRFGILTIREKWEKYLGAKTSTLTEKYLNVKYPMVKGENNILINGSVCPSKELVDRINQLKPDEALVHGEYIIALCVIEKDLIDIESVESSRVEEVEKREVEGINEIETDIEHVKISFPWDLFSLNGKAIKDDFELITKGRKSAKLSDTNRVLFPENVFIEEGVKAEFATINACDGPVYLGKDSELMEGCIIRGAFALGENATVKMSAKIYGPTTIGPHSKVGGEINNCVIFGYTNKAHDGFLGNSVIAEWCNLGADTNNSNLKNTYDEVKVWNYTNEKFISTGLVFCGLIMGDHSKSGINTMFNTGTVVGVNSNIYGAGFQRTFIPSFAWGSSNTGYITYEIQKAIDVAKKVYERRGLDFDQTEIDILKSVFNITFTYRKKNQM